MLVARKPSNRGIIAEYIYQHSPTFDPLRKNIKAQTQHRRHSYRSFLEVFVQKSLAKPLISLALVLLLGAGGIMIITGKADTFIHDANESAKAFVNNIMIDAGGYKQKVTDALLENRDIIAKASGADPAEVDRIIKDFDIENWEACVLPSDAAAVSSYDANYAGLTGTVTTYQDPSYITVSVSGQDITLSVPPEAQDYIPYLVYL